MALSHCKNRGEWSELYVLLHLLASGNLQSHMSNGALAVQSFPVLSVGRTIDGIQHDFRIGNFDIEILDSKNQSVLKSISREQLKVQSEFLLSKIRTGSGRSFAIPESAPILESLGLTKVMGSKEKSDLIVTIYDPRVNKEVKQGFSIKSYLGSRPTIFNASGVTNIEFSIQGSISEKDIEYLNKLGPIALVSELNRRGFRLVLTNMDIRFSENLKMIDSEMDQLIAHIVRVSYQGEGRTMIAILDILVRENPMEYSKANSRIKYEHKIKDLLEAVALGMRPSEPWLGTAEATGGNIIVTTKGDVICHHSLEKDALRTYLFENTSIDTPVRSRHKFGRIVGGKLTLNFQIRMKNR